MSEAALPEERIMVAGGASGIGAALCDLLRDQGKTAVVADVQPGPDGLQLDVTSPEQWERALDASWPLTGLVNCAGVRSRSSFVELDPSDFDRTLAVNLRGPFLGMQAVARRWLDEGGSGAIVNIASVVGVLAMPTIADYVTSKGGVIALTKAAAVELAEHGIRVNAIAPGAIRTPLTEALFDDPERLDFYLGRNPLHRIAEPKEVAEVIEFLLSPRSSYITGDTLYVDGGWSASS